MCFLLKSDKKTERVEGLQQSLKTSTDRERCLKNRKTVTNRQNSDIKATGHPELDILNSVIHESVSHVL